MANEASIIEKSLSQEFRDFLFSRRMEIKNPAAYLDSFRNIGKVDSYNKLAVKKVTSLHDILLFLLVFTSIFTIFAIVFTLSAFESGENLVSALFCDAILIIYYYFMIRTGQRKKDLKNSYMGFRLTLGVIPILSILKEEFDTNPHSVMTIDLSPVEDQLYRVNQIKYLNGKELTFLKTWFTFTSPLQAGGNIRITIADKYRLRTYSKRSSCGNIKSKRKEKTVHFVKVELYLPESKAVLHQQVQKTLDFKAKLLTQGNKTAIAAVGKYVNLHSETDVVLPSAVLTTIAKAFKCYSTV